MSNRSFRYALAALAACSLAALMTSAAAAAPGHPAVGSHPACQAKAHIATVRTWRTAHGAWRIDRINGTCRQAVSGRITAAPAAARSVARAAIPAGARAQAEQFLRAQPASRRDWSCDLLVGRTKSSSYPGYIQGYAQVLSCEGTPYPTECKATAEMEYASPYGWSNDGEGPGEYGCPGHASVITKTCERSSSQTYRALGIFVVIDETGTFTPHEYSSNMTVDRLC